LPEQAPRGNAVAGVPLLSQEFLQMAAFLIKRVVSRVRLPRCFTIIPTAKRFHTIALGCRAAATQGDDVG
jgi:hypothetical protein